jgi:undecaprenyl pyrophosphate synthase
MKWIFWRINFHAQDSGTMRLVAVFFYAHNIKILSFYRVYYIHWRRVGKEKIKIMKKKESDSYPFVGAENILLDPKYVKQADRAAKRH